MTHLIDLVRLLNKNKFKHLEVFVENSKLKIFYEKIADGSLTNEQAAQDFFFPKNKNAKLYYYRLAQQLEERLLNLLFLIDFHKTAANPLQKEVLICYRNYAAVNSLLARFMRAPAIKLAEETIKISLKNEFTDITLPLARHLAVHYGSIDKVKKKFFYYSKIVETSQEILQAEILAEKYYAVFTWHYGGKSSLDLKFAKKIAQFAEELKTYTQRFSSYRLNMIAHLIAVSRYQVVADYENMVIACQEALTFFENKKQEATRTQIQYFSFQLLVAYCMLGNFEKGAEAGKKAVVLSPKENVNWFLSAMALFKLYLHAQKYDLALAYLRETMDNPALSRQPSLTQERWRINEALVFYLIRTGRLPKPPELNIKFRSKRFINEFRLSNQDKAGDNINLITIQILFLLLEKDYDSIIDKMDALSSYAHRHLRRDESYRSNCFIKMLLQLDKGHFNRIAVQRKAEPYYQKLLAVPLSKAKQDFELEIIPYETLWEFALESLSPSNTTKVRDN